MTVSIKEIKNLLEQDYEIEVDSPDGWVGVNSFIYKGMYEEYILILEDGSNPIRCNGEHLFETTVGWVSAHQLSKLFIVEHNPSYSFNNYIF